MNVEELDSLILKTKFYMNVTAMLMILLRHFDFNKASPMEKSICAIAYAGFICRDREVDKIEDFHKEQYEVLEKILGEDPYESEELKCFI